MKKIRGYKRRLRQIEIWKQDNLYLNMDYLKKEQREYVKFRIYPWTPIAMSIFHFPKPKGEVRRRIVESLIDIYENWREQLLETGEPFYLKIWLFESDIPYSQVVCAVGDKLHFYDQTFYKPEQTKIFQLENYRKLAKRLSEYNWDFHFHEYVLFENDYKEENCKTREEFLENKKYLEKMLKKPYRIEETRYNGENQKTYIIQAETVWLGEKKKH